MLVVFPFCYKDVDLLIQLLSWIQKLGTNKSHSALLIADPRTAINPAEECLKLAKEIFKEARIEVALPVDGWIPGSNSLFSTACMMRPWYWGPFLWVEPDAVPTKSGWIDAIQAEYESCGKPFMGAVVTHDTPGYPNPYLEGCAVYPAHTWDLIKPVWDQSKSWTLATAAITVPLAHNSKLFQHFWGQPNKPPTFRSDLKGLSPDAVLFHRCKDGSLIRELDRKMFPSSNKFLVVLSTFRGDYLLAQKNLKWLMALGVPKTHELLIWCEASVHDREIERLKQLASPSFVSVQTRKYPTVRSFNQPWIQAAHYLESLGRSWLYWEPDAVPIKRDVFEKLQSRYDRCGKLFMGPVVPEMGHINGTSIYPANTPQVCPRTMGTNDGAFDTNMKGEMIHLAHNCADLIQHAWVENGGKLMPHGIGIMPTFPTKESLNRLSRTAVLFHRCKDGSLIQQLQAQL